MMIVSFYNLILDSKSISTLENNQDKNSDNKTKKGFSFLKNKKNNNANLEEGLPIKSEELAKKQGN